MLLTFIYLSYLNALWAADKILIDEKNLELADLNLKINQLQKKVAKEKDRQTKLQQELWQTELTLGKLTQQLEHSQQSLSATHTEIISLNQKIATQTQDLNEQYSLLKQQLRAAYQLGQHSYLKLVLSQTNLNDINRLFTYFSYLNTAQNKFIIDLNETLDDMATNKQVLENHQQKLNQLMTETNKKQQALKQNQQYRLKIIDEINLDIKNNNTQLQILQNDKKELGNLISQLNLDPLSGNAASELFVNRQKHLKWPAAGDILDRITQQDQLRFEGIFLAAPAGEPVYAVHDGQVVFANWLRGFGLLVIIDHGAGYMTLYAHNQSLYVSVGDTVVAHSLIARVGNSGGYKQDGLYFEIRHNGKVLNPYEWMMS